MILLRCKESPSECVPPWTLYLGQDVVMYLKGPLRLFNNIYMCTDVWTHVYLYISLFFFPRLINIIWQNDPMRTLVWNDRKMVLSEIMVSFDHMDLVWRCSQFECLPGGLQADTGCSCLYICRCAHSYKHTNRHASTRARLQSGAFNERKAIENADVEQA